MKKFINESAKVKKADVARANAAKFAAAPFYYYAYYATTKAVIRTVALFWSVFGPAARYNLGNPEYAYAVSLKP